MKVIEKKKKKKKHRSYVKGEIEKRYDLINSAVKGKMLEATVKLTNQAISLRNGLQ